jgi:hypothetical protein
MVFTALRMALMLLAAVVPSIMATTTYVSNITRRQRIQCDRLVPAGAGLIDIVDMFRCGHLWKCSRCCHLLLTSFMYVHTRRTYNKQYHAILGEYGFFELEISGDERSMSWKSTLKNIDMLETTLVGVEIVSLNYHLHQQWTTPDADFGIGTACAPAVTGLHYDPFFGCGPASAVPAATCDAMGKPVASYACTPAVYANGEYSKCEVGDLSAKYGPMRVLDEGDASVSVGLDPYPALKAHYEAERTRAVSAEQFASIVFHNGSTRVLCGKLMEGKLDTTTATTSSILTFLVGLIVGVFVFLANLFQM